MSSDCGGSFAPAASLQSKDRPREAARAERAPAVPVRKPLERKASRPVPARPKACLTPIPARWTAEPVTLVAGGPSLTPADLEAIRGKTRVIAVNDACRLAPWADMLYAADRPWWNHYRGVPDFAGEKWTQDKSGGDEAAFRWGLKCIRSERKPGLSFDPALIHQGANSGFQALNIAVLMGCRPIYLLGYDMQPTGGKLHWFGEHPPGVRRGVSFDLFRVAYVEAAPQLAAAGIPVINLSRETALTCFPRSRIDEVF